MGSAVLEKQEDRTEFVLAEKKDSEGWCARRGRRTHVVQVTAVRVLTGPWRQTESGPFECGIPHIGRFWEMQGTTSPAKKADS